MATTWIRAYGAPLASHRCHKLSLPVNHVPRIFLSFSIVPSLFLCLSLSFSALMCIMRINIYGVTLTVSLARARSGARGKGLGLTRNCIRIKMHAA